MSLDEALRLRAAGDHEQALQLLVALSTAAPADALLRFETACVHDFLGREAQAVDHYLAALAGALPDAQRLRAYVGLGSSYRTLGRYAEAERTLLEGIVQFPQAPVLEAFLAMSEYNLGRPRAAIERLLMLLARSSDDAELRSYAAAIEFYASRLDERWT